MAPGGERIHQRALTASSTHKQDKKEERTTLFIILRLHRWQPADSLRGGVRGLRAKRCDDDDSTLGIPPKCPAPHSSALLTTTKLPLSAASFQCDVGCLEKHELSNISWSQRRVSLLLAAAGKDCCLSERKGLTAHNNNNRALKVLKTSSTAGLLKQTPTPRP